MHITEWIRGVIDVRILITFGAFYAILNTVPRNELGFLRRFGIGVVAGVAQILLIAFILKNELRVYRKSISSKE
jgi:hypothetical protein